MIDSRTLPDLPNNPTATNWVEKAGGLPNYMVRVAKHIYWEGKGKYTLDHAIASAVQQTKERAAKGNKEAVIAVAEWERMKSVKLSVFGDDDELVAAINIYRIVSGRLSEDRRTYWKTQILEAVDSVTVSLSHARARVPQTSDDVNFGYNVTLSNDIGTGRVFDESKFRRVGGKFAAKPNGNVKRQKSSPQTAKQAIEGLGVGAEFNIPGIDGTIKRTEDGFVITGPNGFTTNASSVVEAMAIAARLIRQSGKAKVGGK